MEMSIKFTGKNPTDVFKGLNNFQNKMSAPMEKSIKWITESMAEDKPKTKGAFTRYATSKQKRAYWARVRSGEAKHSESTGYVRSGKTAKSLRGEARRYSGGVRGEVTSSQAHAIYVHGDYQQRFLKHWSDGERAFKKNEPRINAEFEKVIKKAAES
jgi:hypothetical protein